jgi:hypothetical protein
MFIKSHNIIVLNLAAHVTKRAAVAGYISDLIGI